MSNDLNTEEFVMGFDNIDDPKVLVVTIPIKKFAEAKEGTVLLRGHMEEAKMFAVNKIALIRQKQNQAEAINSAKLVKPIHLIK
ncbi:MAG: hypothetical protein EKK55_17360 [Rhodocyclaceae bacterium]|nr:MAG: hypothetical protein EKK55_17360 [Rhodocyclaceae bacterium]